VKGKKGDPRTTGKGRGGQLPASTAWYSFGGHALACGVGGGGGDRGLACVVYALPALVSRGAAWGGVGSGPLVGARYLVRFVPFGLRFGFFFFGGDFLKMDVITSSTKGGDGVPTGALFCPSEGGGGSLNGGGGGGGRGVFCCAWFDSAGFSVFFPTGDFVRRGCS